MARVAVVAAICLGVAFAVAPPVAAAWSSGTFSAADEDLMVQLINEARADAGVAPLAVHPDVHEVARWRSQDMIDRDYFSHAIPPEGYRVDHYLAEAGVSFWWWGENIGKDTISDGASTQSTFDWWMGSSAHRANMLEPRATHVGVGAYKGTWGSAANTHMWTLVLIQAPYNGDTTPPTVTPPTSRLYTPSTLGGTTMPVRTSWSASDPSGVARYKLQVQVDGGSWTTVSLASWTSKWVKQALTQGTPYRYRVRAWDAAGNRSAWAYGPTFVPRRTQQSSSAVTYGGAWTTVVEGSASGGSYAFTSSAGAWASFTFTGASVGWVSIRSVYGGSADVYVDDVLVKTVDLSAASVAWRMLVFTRSWSSQGTHTIKLVARGDGRVYVDAFVRLVHT
jgi:uncharacterized protein YkwD